MRLTQGSYKAPRVSGLWALEQSCFPGFAVPQKCVKGKLLGLLCVLQCFATEQEERNLEPELISQMSALNPDLKGPFGCMTLDLNTSGCFMSVADLSTQQLSHCSQPAEAYPIEMAPSIMLQMARFKFRGPRKRDVGV